ncbi:MAG: zinc ribbon domain-containing protein [Terriglobales bacterium]
MNCPLCSEPLAERGFFCKACAGQVRCKNCRELLEPAGMACVECGTKIGESMPNAEQPELVMAGALPPHRNTLSYQETRTNRTFHASLTDTAIQGLGEVFGDFFLPRGTPRSQMHPRRVVGDTLALPVGMPHSVPGNGHHDPAPTPSNGESVVEEKERILRLFHPNGDDLELKDNRLKAKSQSDFVRRLTYLFLYAHELHGRPSASYEKLRSIHQVAKVWDANTRTWLTKRVGFTVDADNSLKLNAPGREEALKAMNDALNPEVQDDWNPDRKVPRKLGPRKKA